MRQDLTDITLIVDRSGSMSAIKDDAEGGVNQFIDDQKQAAGDALLTLVQFDDKYEVLHKGEDIKKATKYTLNPRGSTALLDAVGKAIVETGERLSAMSEAERPATVICVIVTDGHENSSHEFSKEKIKEMIDRQRTQFNWQFVFLGADEKGFAEARDMGILTANRAVYAAANVGQAYKRTSDKVRGARLKAAGGQHVNSGDFAYTDEEREELKKK